MMRSNSLRDPSSFHPNRDFKFRTGRPGNENQATHVLNGKPARHFLDMDDDDIFTNYEEEKTSGLFKEDLDPIVAKQSQKLDSLGVTMRIPNSDPLYQPEDSSNQDLSLTVTHKHNKSLDNEKMSRDSRSGDLEENETTQEGCVSIASNGIFYIEDPNKIGEVFDKQMLETINRFPHIILVEQQLEEMKNVIKDKKRLQKERNVLTAQLSRDRKKIEVELLHRKCYELTALINKTKNVLGRHRLPAELSGALEFLYADGNLFKTEKTGPISPQGSTTNDASVELNSQMNVKIRNF